MINPTLLESYTQDGFAIARGLFSSEEVEELKAHFQKMHAARQDHLDARLTADEPLAKFPRLMQPHHHDQTAREWLLNSRLDACLTTLLGASPFAVQTMYYFKPPMARGQALHQDQFYLQVQPGTCMAAWMAIDPCDEENGCLQVVPGTHLLPTLCTKSANLDESFADDTVDLPEGMEPVPVVMEPGDVLFFNGQLVHGSFPNSSETRFRRSLIGHYIVAEAEKVANWYNPVLNMDGSAVDIEFIERGGPCGVWVDRDGTPVAELTGTETRV
ncbi:MAG: phytanoyl-CoA dioxygenase family protein [Chloroflexota bacterium]